MDLTYKLYSSLPMLLSHKVRAEIDLSALRDNYRAAAAHIRRSSPDCRPVCVIKADAYGHGAVACTEALLEEGCRFFAVSGVEEAIAVRRVCDRMGAKDANILILGYTPADEVPALISNDIIQACFSYPYACELSRRTGCLSTLRVHFAVDTGMNRIGFSAQDEAQILRSADELCRAAALPGLRAEGAFTHFARADETGPEADAVTEGQARRFLELTDLVRSRGVALPMRHVCNSAGALRFPAWYMDACRLGVVLYGVSPTEECPIPLKPVLYLRSVISHVHTLHPGESVSYGGCFTADREMLCATVPVGYADGFLRAYSGARAVITAPDGTPRGEGRVIGRICMDQCMMDISDTAARVGDTVTLIGEKGQLDDLARRAGTINYECLCLISARVPRITVKGLR